MSDKIHTDDEGTGNPLVDALKQTTKAKPQEQPEEGKAEQEQDGDPGEEGGQEPPPAPSDDDPFTKDDGAPFTRKDHTALNEALKKARKDARDAQAEVTRLTAAAGGKDVATAVAEADQRAAEKWKPIMVRTAARGAFAEAGLSLPEGRADEVLARAIRLLDVDALTISDEGMVEGLAEQVESIRSDFPDLFGQAKRERPAVPKVQAAERTAGPVKPKSAAEQLAAKLMAGAA